MPSTAWTAMAMACWRRMSSPGARARRCRAGSISRVLPSGLASRTWIATDSSTRANSPRHRADAGVVPTRRGRGAAPASRPTRSARVQAEARPDFSRNARRFPERLDLAARLRVDPAEAPAGREGVEEPAWAAARERGIEHVHGYARGTGLRHHVDRIGRTDDAVRPGQQARVGVGAVRGSGPEHAGYAAKASAQQRDDFARGAPGHGGEHAALFVCA